MELLLSGATSPGIDQRNVFESLGGYISSTRVPNSVENSLFGELTNFGEKNGFSETIGVFLLNNDNEDIKNLVIKNILPNEFGKEESIVKFEFAAVEPQNKNYIEKIGNMRETPYNADFFEPNCKREFALINIVSAGESGDVIEILGKTNTLYGDTKIDVLNAILDCFKNDDIFNVEIIDENNLYIERIEIEQTNDPIILTTAGSAKIEPTQFGGGFDNGVLLIEKLCPGDSLGIWIRRSFIKEDKNIKKKDCSSCCELEKKYNELFGDDFSEGKFSEFENKISKDEVIFDWD